MPTVIHELADAFLRRKQALAERGQAKTKLAGSDYFMPKSAKEDLNNRLSVFEQGGLPELLKQGASEMYHNPIVNTAISLTPGAGDVQSGYEAVQSAKEGKWGEAGLNALGVLPFIPALGGIMVGKSSKTWDAIAAAEAAKRLEAGEDAAQVYKETGYAIAPWDKQLRKEISDASAEMTPANWKKTMPHISLAAEESNIESVFKHPELYNAYPEFKNTDIVLNPDIQATASWHKADPEIGLGAYMQWKVNREDAINRQADWVARLKDPESPDYWKTQVQEDMKGPFAYASEEEGMNQMQSYLKEQENKLKFMKEGGLNESTSVPLHELQHGVQDIEGWARGGSHTEFAYDAQKAMQEIESVNKQLAMLSRSIDSAKASGDIAKADEFKRMYDEAMDYKLNELVPRANIDPIDAYQRLAGEAEARLVQSRRLMTEEQMRQQYPFENKYFHKQTGVPLSSLITKFDETKDVNKPFQ